MKRFIDLLKNFNMKRFIALVLVFFLGFTVSNIVALGFTKCLSNINWNFIHVLIVFIGFILIYQQLEAQRLSNTIASLDILEKKWNSKEMMTKRILICKFFLALPSNKYVPGSTKSDNSNLGTTSYDVLGFFEDMGIFVKSKAINIENTWTMYGQCIAGYWNISKKTITKRRKKDEDKTYYENFEWLYDKIREISENREDCPHFIKEGDEDDIIRFAKDEIEYIKESQSICNTKT